MGSVILASENDLNPAEVVELPPQTVTATRGPDAVDDVPMQVSLYGREEVGHSAALTMDDFLRRTPGFSLFRRSSSLVAHPTTQGASLRGVGPTGASRALVLRDGIPVNDPFGGWVYWSKIPMASVQRVEVLRGGGSTAWGNAAMAGAINVISRPLEPGWTVEGLAGNRGTARTSIHGAEQVGPVMLGVNGHFFTTDGYHVVHPDSRGPIDEPAFSRHRGAEGTAVAQIGEATLSVRAGGFAEDRGNGTPYTRNDTRSGRVSSRLELVDRDDIRWEWSFFGEHSVFASRFSAVNADRTGETPALDQFDVPSSIFGTALSFWTEVGDKNEITGAGDLRWITGETNEEFAFDQGDFTRRRRAGGSQSLAGIFLENAYEPNEQWRLSIGGRLDYWRNFDGEIKQWDQESGERIVHENPQQRDGSVFSPRAGVVHRVSDAVSLRGSVYQGFRTPTINELYRPFWVGADETLANSQLDPEKLTGSELGTTVQFSEQWHGLVSGFWNTLRDPIANVTIGESAAGGAQRQRQNLGRASIYGVEVETGYQLHPNWSVSAGGLWVTPVVRRAPQQPELEGRWLAQTPRREATIRSRWQWNEKYMADLQGRYIGPQFEDDLNTRRLSGYWVTDLYVAWLIGNESAVFAGAENLFDRVYTVGETGDGLRTIGQPFMFHAGVRWRF